MIIKHETKNIMHTIEYSKKKKRIGISENKKENDKWQKNDETETTTTEFEGNVGSKCERWETKGRNGT